MHEHQCPCRQRRRDSDHRRLPPFYIATRPLAVLFVTGHDRADGGRQRLGNARAVETVGRDALEVGERAVERATLRDDDVRLRWRVCQREVGGVPLLLRRGGSVMDFDGVLARFLPQLEPKRAAGGGRVRLLALSEPAQDGGLGVNLDEL